MRELLKFSANFRYTTPTYPGAEIVPTDATMPTVLIDYWHNQGSQSHEIC